MRDLTKSVLSFSWAMSVFGLRQAASVVSSQGMGSANAAFQAVTRTVGDQLGPVTRPIFQAGDGFQRGAVELAVSLTNPASWNPANALRQGADLLQRTAHAGMEALRGSAQTAAKTAGGWGPMPNAQG